MQVDNTLLNLNLDSALVLLFKLLFIAGGLLYLVFSLVAHRQITIMKKTLTTPLSPIVTVLGIAHLAMTFFTLAFFIFAI